MTAPTPNWPLVRVTHRYTGADGLPATGAVVFTPHATRWEDTDALTTVLPRDIVGELVNGMLDVQLPSTDYAPGGVTGWTWGVAEKVAGGLRYNVELPASLLSVDLGTLAPLPAAPGDYPVVRGPQGEPGQTGPQGIPGSGHIVGSGPPSGPTLTAAVGTTYADTAVTVGASLWQKVAVGSTLNAWRVIAGDTNWQNVTSYVPGVASGQFFIRRVIDLVYYRFVALTASADVTSSVTIPVPTAGYRPTDTSGCSVGTGSGNRKYDLGTSNQSDVIAIYGSMSAGSWVQGWRVANPISGTVVAHPTQNPWPTALIQ